MTNGRDKTPSKRKETVTRCMSCGNELVVIDKNGELAAKCYRQKCRNANITTPIRVSEFMRIPDGVNPAQLEKLFEAVKEGRLDIDTLLDPLASYRAIDGLLVVGVPEWEKAFMGPDNKNPLGLKPGWIPDVPLPSEWTPELFQKLVDLCKKPEWNCSPVLELELTEVSGVATSFVNLYGWFGVEHDGLGPGIIWPDLDYSNWFIKQGIKGWPDIPATLLARWKVGYVDFPDFTTKKHWENQQKIIAAKGLVTSSAASDALMLLLIKISYGKWYRTSTWARIATIHGGCPLDVSVSSGSLNVRDYWVPGSANGGLGASVEGVPNELK